MLTPDGGTQKIFKVTIAAFFLCCLLAPFFFGHIDLNFDTSTAGAQFESYQDDLQRTVQQQMKQSSESAVRQTLFSYLTAQKINVKEIEVKMDTREDTSIEMNQVTVVLDNADRAQADKIKELLSTQFSIDAQIVYS